MEVEQHKDMVAAQDLDRLCESLDIRFIHLARRRHETLKLHPKAKRGEAFLLEKCRVVFTEPEGRGIERRGLGHVAKTVEQNDPAHCVGEPAAAVRKRRKRSLRPTLLRARTGSRREHCSARKHKDGEAEKRPDSVGPECPMAGESYGGSHLLRSPS